MISIYDLMDDVKLSLKDFYEEEEDSDFLELCAKRAINCFKSFRNYPSGYSEKKINADVESHYYCIVDLTLYWFSKNGNEFEKNHVENGVSISWNTEEDVFRSHGVFKYATSLS